MKTKLNINKTFINGILVLIFVILIITNTMLNINVVKADGNNIEVLNSKEETATHAKSMVVIEASSGRVLYQKNCNEQRAMASTTKIMTAYVAIKNCIDLDEKFKVDDRSVGIEGTSLYLRKDEEKTMRELLYGLMLPSGNDAAVAIACRIAGSPEKFVELMNEEVENLGLKNTNFANPHGLDEKNHYTSAYDLAIITAEAMKNETFREIVGTKNVKINGNQEVKTKSLQSKNKLLWNMEGCEGVKTGFTDNAYRCFVASAKRDDMRLICVVLNCGPMFEEAERLLNKGFEEYKLYNILEAYAQHDNVSVDKGVEKEVQTFSIKKFALPLTNEEYKDIDVKITLPNKIEAPIKKEQQLGEIKVMYKDKTLFKDNVYAMNEVKSTKFFDKLEQIVNYWNI